MTVHPKYNFGILTFIVGLASLGLLYVSINRVYASVSSYTASGFAQFCANNSSTCNKVDASGRSGSASCPSITQVITAVYVHAGGGQTVYQLPDDTFSASFSNNQNTVNVTAGNDAHDLSWIGVVCGIAPTNTPVPPTATPTTTTPTSTTTPTQPIPTSTTTPTQPIPTPTTGGGNTGGVPTPTFTPTPTSGQGNGGPEPTNTPTPTSLVDPTTTPTSAPTATPTPTSDNNSNNSASNSSNNSSGGGSTNNSSSSNNSGGQVLGASTLAATGTFTDSLSDLTLLFGFLLFFFGAVHAQKKV